jgi:16S rRNA (uracil1498-N3)-methyltransferase
VRRVFIDGLLADEIKINGTDGHHIIHVLRAKIGQKLIVVDASQTIAEAEIIAFNHEEVILKCIKQIDANTEAPIEVVLAQCLPKADKMDFVVQKAVELGVSSIVPVISTNCVVKYDATKQIARRTKWQKIANEAAKQCGRTIQPVVEPIVRFKEVLENLDPDTAAFICYEGQTDIPIRDFLRHSTAQRFFVLIGPEGGFTPEEVELCLKNGVRAVTMGPRILRSETASLAAVSLVMYENGDLGGRGL